MLLHSRFKVNRYHLGLVYEEGDLTGVLEPGIHKIFNPLARVSVKSIDQRRPFVTQDLVDDMIRSGLLEDRLTLLQLNDDQRALVWVDGRFSDLIGPGSHAYFHTHRDVRIEVVKIDAVRFLHDSLHTIIRDPSHKAHLDVTTVHRTHVALLEIDGRYEETLSPGIHAFWRASGNVKCVPVDLREQTLELAGQEIMTADKVSLRLNAQVSFRVTDALQARSQTEDYVKTLYREAQMALRAWVAKYDLDGFLNDKDSLSESVKESLQGRSQSLGLEIVGIGIRDVILPGDMKDLMNRVTASKKAAEANLIARREETAAIRSQANTAKILADNPTLMRLRELEVLEKVTASAELKVVLGENGLADKVVNLM